MLMRYDPFREVDRFTDQLFGNNAEFAESPWMPMDAVRKGDAVGELFFDVPGVDPGSIDVNVERNVLTIKAERLRGSRPRATKPSPVSARTAHHRARSSSGRRSTPTTSRPHYDQGVLEGARARRRAGKAQEGPDRRRRQRGDHGRFRLTTHVSGRHSSAPPVGGAEHCCLRCGRIV